MQIRNIVLMFHLETIILFMYFLLNSNCANKNYAAVKEVGLQSHNLPDQSQTQSALEILGERLEGESVICKCTIRQASVRLRELMF